MRETFRLCVGFLLCLAACGTSPGTADVRDAVPDAQDVPEIVDAPDAGDALDARDAPDPSADSIDASTPMLGTFSVVEQTSIYAEQTNRRADAMGSFTRSPMPPFLTLASTQDGCELWTYDPDRCGVAGEGGCSWDQVCATDGTCIPWPARASVGPLTLSGLLGRPDQVIQPDAYNAYYVAQFPYPPPTDLFDASSMVSIRAPGADLPALDLEVRGVDPLVVDEAAYTTVAMGTQDATLRWTAGNPEDRVRLTIPSVNRCHGCPPLGKIVCEAPDTGSLVVPGALLAALPRVMAGICVGIDCPQATLERYRSAFAVLPQGLVELHVASVVGFGIEHAELPPPDPGFRIAVAETRAAGQAGIGFVYVENPPAAEMFQAVTAQVGGCRFLEPADMGVCEPFCAWPGFCAADNTCHEGLPQRWAGDIALSGLNATCSLPIDTSSPYHYYAGKCDPVDPPDLFDAGSTITATAAGGTDLPAFTLSSPGVAEIQTTLPCDTFALQAGTPVQVDWTPSGQAGDRIRFALISANHGTQFGHIECDVPDTGSLWVDASLVDLHLAAFNPVPSWNLARVHSAGTTLDGTRVVLEVASRVSCTYGH